MNRRLLHLALVLAVFAPLQTLGCATCFGKTDSPMAVGMNYGIFALLAVIGTMLSLVASFFVFIVRRSGQTPEITDPTDTGTPLT